MRPHDPHGVGCRTAAVEVRGYACVCTGTNHLQAAQQEQGNAEAAAHQENTEVERNVPTATMISFALAIMYGQARVSSPFSCGFA